MAHFGISQNGISLLYEEMPNDSIIHYSLSNNTSIKPFIRVFNNETNNPSKFFYSKENFNKIEYLKIDLVIFLVDSFKEMSINYWLSPNKHDVEKSIINDIKEQLNEGNYYKAVKWSFSLAKFLDDKPKGLMISEFLNNYTGAEYKLLKNLKAIKLLLENYDDPLIRKRIRVNLINNKITPKVSVVYKLIPRLEKKVNLEAKKYYYDTLAKKFI